MKFRILVSILTAGLALSSHRAQSQGFPNVPQTPGALLSGGLLAPQQGRTAIIAWHNGWLYTIPEHPSSMPGSDYQGRRWNIADPTNAQVMETLGISGSSTSAHGYHKLGDYLMLGGNGFDFIHSETGEHHFGLPYVWRAVAPNVNERTPYPNPHPIYSRGDLYRPYYTSMFWSYSDLDDEAVLGHGQTELASWDHLGQTGVIGHPFIIGNLLIFASDQSRTGVATYDISDPSAPQLLDILTTGGPGGYWPELWGGDGRLLILFPYRTGGNGIRVVDATDPSNLNFLTDVPLSGASCMYAQFQDHYAFTGSHKIDMRTLSSVLELQHNPTELDTSQFALPVGNLLVTGGAGPGQGMAIWAHDAAPDTNGPTVGFHIPRAGQTNYPLSAPISLLIHETLESPTIVNGETFIVRPQGGQPLEGMLRWTFNDSLTFTPDSPLLPNTTYEVVIPAGGITDAAGNGIEPYAFSFSTGNNVSGNQAPEITQWEASVYPAAPGQNVSLTAAASDPDGDTLSYRFDYGDGSPRTDWLASPQTQHAYALSGHYRALVQVQDPQGLLDTQAVTVTVTEAITPSQPERSSPIQVDTANRRIWVVNPDNNTVTQMNADTLAVTFETPVGADPRSVAIDAAGNAWVACRDGDRIDIIDPNGALLQSLALDYGDAPFGIAMSPDRQTAFISLFGSGALARFDTASRQATGQLDLGPTPRALALSPDGTRIYVTRFLSPQHRGEIWEVDTAQLVLTRRLEIEKFGGVLHRDGTADGMGVANYLSGLAVSPDGTRLIVASNKMNTDKGALSGPDLDHDNTVRNILSRFDLSTGQLLEAIDIDNSDSVSAVAFSPLGDYIWATLQGNNDCLILDHLAFDGGAGLRGFVTRRSVGSAPQGITFDSATDRILVKNFLSRSVTSLDAGSFLETGVVQFAIDEVETVGTEALSAEVLLGKQTFYHASPEMSGEGYISCATCHLDGGQDGRVWDFTGRGEGLRNTITLRGRSGTGHGPVHWSANFDEIQDFEHDIRGFFGGDGFLSDAQFASANTPLGASKAGLDPTLDALAAYVTSLDNESLPRSPHREPNGTLSSAAQAGQIIFETLDCRSCHAGDDYLDLQVHDVGTLRPTSGNRLGQSLLGIDTPTLRGIWATAPYFHDGSAPDLESVFSVAGGELYPAEAGQVANGASIQQGMSVSLNFDDTARDAAYVQIQGFGSLTLDGLDGGSGGTGAIEIRYTHGDAPYLLNISVNGVLYETALPPVENGIPWRFVNWRTLRLEGVELQPGTSNTVVMQGTHQYFNASIDDVVISTPENLLQAEPHRRVQQIAPSDRTNLLAFLRVLDGNPIPDIPVLPVTPQLSEPVGGTPFTQEALRFALQFDRGVTGIQAEDLIVSGTAQPQSTTLDTISAGTHYEVVVTGMQHAGTVSVSLPEGAALDLAGTPTTGASPVVIDWQPFVDDLAPLGDEFQNPASLAEWTRLNDVEGWQADKLEVHDVATSRPDHMRLMPYTATWFMDLTGPFVFKEITGDFAVTMQMDVQRRNGQPGRPTRQFSLGGIMIRSPRPVSAAAPTPSAPATDLLPWPPYGYQTDWIPDSENYIFLSVGTSDNNGPSNIWNYEVKTTLNGNSTLYYGREGVPADTGVVTLQAIRRGDTFLLLRQHEGGEWIVENRYERPDMPPTLQVGITTYTDWNNIVSNGMFSNGDDHRAQFHHNRNIITEANGFAAAPDLVVDVDYVRYSRPRTTLTEAALEAVPVSAGGAPVWLSDTALQTQVGAALNAPTPPATFPIGIDWPNGPIDTDPVVFTTTFPQPVTDFTASDIVIGGTASPQNIQLTELISQTQYQVTINGMQANGTVTMSIPANAATGADGRPNTASLVYQVDWKTYAEDDLMPLSDEFNDPATLTDWQRLNDVEGWNADKLEVWDIDSSQSGQMRLTPYASSWYSDLTGPLVFKEISGDFVVTTQMEVQRRNQQPGRPTAYFSLGGIMLRKPRTIQSAAPDPLPAPWVQLPWPPVNYATDWTPGQEDYLFFSLGHSIGYGTDQWNLQVKNTDDSQSTLYHNAVGVPSGTGIVTLQIVRLGTTLLLLRQHPGGEWIVENRFERPDLPGTLQVGIAAYTDWAALPGNGMFTNPSDPAPQFQHNHTTITPASGFGSNPDLVADVDYVRFRRPHGISLAQIQALPLTATSSSIQWLADTALNGSLGDFLPGNPTGAAGAQPLSIQASHARVGEPADSLLLRRASEPGSVTVEHWSGNPARQTPVSTVWYSPDLRNWTSVEALAVDSPERQTYPDGSQTTRWTLPISEGKHGFFRLQHPSTESAR